MFSPSRKQTGVTPYYFLVENKFNRKPSQVPVICRILLSREASPEFKFPSVLSYFTVALFQQLPRGAERK